MLLQICNGLQDFGGVGRCKYRKKGACAKIKRKFKLFSKREIRVSMLTKGLAIMGPSASSNGRGLDPAVSEFPTISPPEKLQDMSEDRLIELTLAGDESAYETLVRRHSRRVFSIARHFFRSQETVEDIAQETFAKAFFSLASYRRGASFEQWVAKIAVNNCYDELRRRKKRSESLITDLSDDDESWLENKLASTSFQIHIHEAERERAAEISEKLLAKLTVEDRLIITLLHAENNSVREIAAMLGWSEAKVKIRAFRARHTLRRALARLQMTEDRKTATIAKLHRARAEEIEEIKEEKGL
jgi:RNA polymerase sigma-70 factor, ECF subfamily